MNTESINLILSKDDGLKQLYGSGGFARNEMFVRLLANFYPDMEVYTSSVDNSSALGAALMVWDAMDHTQDPAIDLGLTRWLSFQ